MDLQNYHEWIAERQRLLERIKELEAENVELRKRLGEDVVPIKQEPYAMQTLSLQEKVGSESTKEKRKKMEYLQSIPSSEPLVIVATGKYVGEGFDYARLDTLFLVLPVAWKGIVAQYAGRLHRDYEGKQDVQIYDISNPQF